MPLKYTAVVLPALTFAATANAAIEDDVYGLSHLASASVQQPAFVDTAALSTPSVEVVFGDVDADFGVCLGPALPASNTDPSGALNPTNIGI